MQESSRIQSDIQAAIEAGKQLATQPFEIGGTPMVIIPNNHSVHQFDNLRQFPERIKQNTIHSTANSFIDYYNGFAEEDSVIFIDDNNQTFRAIIDYHSNDPGWCNHTAQFTLKNTEEWKNWQSNNKKSMSQEEFGRFIEDNLDEIIEPSGAEMLEIALSIQAKTEVKFSQAQRIDNGQMQLSYHELIDGTAGNKGNLKIPQTFKIGLRLSEGGDAYQLDARLRYRIREGNLALWYELIRPHKTIRANLEDTEKLINSKILSGNIYHGIV